MENAGIVLIEDEGVKLNKADIVVLEGQQGFVTFMTDVMNDAKKGNLEICVSSVDERNWEKHSPKDFTEIYFKEMRKAKNLTSKILVRHNDNYLAASDYAQYRTIPDNLFSEDISFYLYGSKLALVSFFEENVQITILKNKRFADSFRTMFNAIWNNTEVMQ